MRKPNTFQRLVHHFVMIRPVTAFFAPRLHRLDGLILKLTNAKRTLSELMGWNIVLLHTVGARTGKPHVTPLIGVIDEPRIALIASNFGRKIHPAWYYNLLKHPECAAQFNGRTGHYLARETDGEEREKYWQLALFWYAGYEKYKQRAAPRRIPVMLLEPR